MQAFLDHIKAQRSHMFLLHGRASDVAAHTHLQGIGFRDSIGIGACQTSAGEEAKGQARVESNSTCKIAYRAAKRRVD